MAGLRMKEHIAPDNDGLSIPPEWHPHAGCLVSWPCKEDTWCDFSKEDKKAYTEVIEAVNKFEPAVVLSDPSTLAEARKAVDKKVHVIEIGLDDAWIRDNGPTFVSGKQGTQSRAIRRFRTVVEALEQIGSRDEASPQFARRWTDGDLSLTDTSHRHSIVLI